MKTSRQARRQARRVALARAAREEHYTLRVHPSWPEFTIGAASPAAMLRVLQGVGIKFDDVGVLHTLDYPMGVSPGFKSMHKRITQIRQWANANGCTLHEKQKTNAWIRAHERKP